ncbi:uncharacterized protein LJ206_014498 [Theristicus caerulescens]
MAEAGLAARRPRPTGRGGQRGAEDGAAGRGVTQRRACPGSQVTGRGRGAAQRLAGRGGPRRGRGAGSERLRGSRRSRADPRACFPRAGAGAGGPGLGEPGEPGWRPRAARRLRRSAAAAGFPPAPQGAKRPPCAKRSRGNLPVSYRHPHLAASPPPGKACGFDWRLTGQRVEGARPGTPPAPLRRFPPKAVFAPELETLSSQWRALKNSHLQKATILFQLHASRDAIKAELMQTSHQWVMSSPYPVRQSIAALQRHTHEQLESAWRCTASKQNSTCELANSLVKQCSPMMIKAAEHTRWYFNMEAVFHCHAVPAL